MTHSDITPDRLRELASEWYDLDAQASLTLRMLAGLTEAEIVRYDKLPLRMAMALQAVADLIKRHAATLAARDALLRRADRQLLSCADHLSETTDPRSKDIHNARALADEIAAALKGSEPNDRRAARDLVGVDDARSGRDGEATLSDERTCAECRFSRSHSPGGAESATGHVWCGWVFGTFDEAGDRMPLWAFEILALHPSAHGELDRAEDCPAFEEGL